jgi:hypothetical protein
MSKLPPLFAAISIQTNSRCNLSCPFCFYGQYENYATDEIIETEVVYRIFDELARLNFRGRVSLYNMNEPLTDGRILDLLTAARARLPDCFHLLSTNATLLTQTLLDQLLVYVDRLRINQYHTLPPLDYTSPKIDVQDKRGFLHRAGSNRGGNLRDLPAAAQASTGPCANPFGQLVIMPPGTAVLCCADGFKQVQLGDVRTEALERIWYGRGFQAIRASLAGGRRDKLPLCRVCSVVRGGFYEYFLTPSRFEHIIEGYRRSLYA